MNKNIATWRVEVAASATSVEPFEQTLEPYCQAISWFVTETMPNWRIEGYCDVKPDTASLIAALGATAAALGVAAPKVFIHRLAIRDWLAENLTTFPPLTIGRYFIYPTHYQGKIPPGQVSICLNPGMAFGSGEHASTNGCLQALDWLARRRRFGTALDMGCGSGILAMAIAGTWQIPVLASDIDMKAITVATDNARRNQVKGMVRVVRGNGYISRAVHKAAPFDMIVSNILANPLCRMSADLGRCLKKRRSVAILSGFLECDANRVMAAHRQHGLKLLRRFKIGEWQTLVLGRDQ